MERGPNSKDEITKARRFPQGTAKKLESIKKVNGNDKRSHKDAIQQEEAKVTRIEEGKQCVAGSQEYSLESTLKEVGPEKIWIF